MSSDGLVIVGASVAGANAAQAARMAGWSEPIRLVGKEGYLPYERPPLSKAVDANPELHEWHTVTYRTRLPGLKWGRTLWLASLAGGPFEYTGRELRDAHFEAGQRARWFSTT
jgi:NADPH-dependent 2,4-dienoyl-CoA reductase/sulfur reductase-like enzyme